MIAACPANKGIRIYRMNIEDLYKLAKQARQFGGAALNHAKNKFKMTSEEEQKKRLEICNSCEFIDNNKDNPRCHECGCFLNIKTGWASQRCPIGKWEAVEPEEKGPGCGGCRKRT